MRSGSHALLHVEKSEKMRFFIFLTAMKILHVRVWKNMKKYSPIQVYRTLNHFIWNSGCWDIGGKKGACFGKIWVRGTEKMRKEEARSKKHTTIASFHPSHTQFCKHHLVPPPIISYFTIIYPKTSPFLTPYISTTTIPIEMIQSSVYLNRRVLTSSFFRPSHEVFS